MTKLPAHAYHYQRLIRMMREDVPGAKWQGLYHEFEASYLRWFTKEGLQARPPYLLSRKRLIQTMPEFEGLYDSLVELAGGSDSAARLLSLYNPTPYISGCSQLVWLHGEKPLLIRNYDYNPNWWEGVALETNWLGTRVLGMSDCLWGLLDGQNEHGLVVSLTFGGRKLIGDGFGIPLILRYVLQTCATAKEAIVQLSRIPAHMAYNVTVLDAEGDYATIFLRPDAEPLVQQLACTTNHQETRHWSQYMEATKSLIREEELERLLAMPATSSRHLVERFLKAPLFAQKYKGGFGTLYTAVYSPVDKSVSFDWRTTSVQLKMGEFSEQSVLMNYDEPALKHVDPGELVPHMPLH